MAHASALGRCTHHLAGQQTMPSAGDAVVCSPQATHCAPPADIGWAGGSGVGCRYWRRHLGGSLPLFSGVNATRVRPYPIRLRLLLALSVEGRAYPCGRLALLMHGLQKTADGSKK